MKRDGLEELLSRDLDGVLSPSEQVALRAAEAADPELAALRLNWQRVGAELRQENLPGQPTPEAMWQDVQRAIRLAGEQDSRERHTFGWRMIWAAGLVVVLFVAVLMPHILGRPGLQLAATPRPSVQVEYVETDLPGASTLVYEDEESGWALVWVTQDQPVEAPRGT